MANKFTARYCIDDGYVGNRPKYFSISEHDIEDDMDESELRSLYQESVDDAFRRDISAYGENENEFVEWALATIKASKC